MIINGLRGVQDQQYEQHKDRWEAARFQAVTMLNAWTKDNIEPEKLVTFPWEEDKKKPTGPLTYNSLLNMLGPIAQRMQ